MMPCDTQLKPRQTISERKQEVRQAVVLLEKLLAQNAVKVVVGPQGAVAFQGWNTVDRGGVTDACAYRRLMATGGVTAKMAVARAEQLAGRPVSKQAVGQGAHSHDGGRTWHGHKG